MPDITPIIQANVQGLYNLLLQRNEDNGVDLTEFKDGTALHQFVASDPALRSYSRGITDGQVERSKDLFGRTVALIQAKSFAFNDHPVLETNPN